MIYAIYEMVNVGTINISQVYQTSVDTLRLSVNGEKTILKFTGETPDFLVGLQQYTHSEMLEIVQTPDWNPEN